jgi:hypothetical protein
MSTVDNKPISEQVSDGNSITVPSDEVWRVSIVGQAAATADGASATKECLINGNVAASSVSASYDPSGSTDGEPDNDSASTTFPLSAVLDGGDTVSASGTNLHIGGYEVS